MAQPGQNTVKARIKFEYVVCCKQNCVRKRGSYMSAHVLLNLSKELRKRDKMRGLLSILSSSATSLIYSIIQEHEC